METKIFNGKNGAFDIGYYVYLPSGFDKSKKFPMIVFLHGAGERGNGKDELPLVNVNGLSKYASEGMEIPAILLCPQCPKDITWNNIVFELKSLIDETADEYGADKDRISLTGLSMGGFGTWEMGMSFPNFFSALAPVCGGGLEWRAGLIGKTPVWAFHGDKDDVVPPERSYEMVDAVKFRGGGKPRLTIFHGVGHASWDDAYLTTKVIEWLIKQVRVDTVVSEHRL